MRGLQKLVPERSFVGFAKATTLQQSVRTKIRLLGWSASRDCCTREIDLTNQSLETIPLAADEDADSPAPAAAPTTGGPSKYVPPSTCNRGPGESVTCPGGSLDDLPTLRVTNISEDTEENDLRELFDAFRRVVRVYVGRDRDTGIGKGVLKNGQWRNVR